MGLETLELVMKVEETFDIRILDDDAEKILTVGQLYEHILAKLPPAGPSSGRCASAVVFYRFRRVLMAVLGLDRQQVRLDAPMESLIPREHRREIWKRLEGELGWRLPWFRLPSWAAGLSFYLALVPMVFLFGYFAFLTNFDLKTLLSVGLALLVLSPFLCVLIDRAFQPLEVEFSSDCETLRGTVATTARRNLRKIWTGTGFDREDVWKALRAIFVDLFDVPPEEITESTRILDLI